MFSRPNVLDSNYLIADYIEYLCLLKGNSVSSTDLRSLLSMSDDELNNNGIESSDDVSIDCLEEAMAECNSRSLLCHNRYPFEYNRIELKNKQVEEQYREIYAFLLFVTRFNMNTQKIQNGEDATKVFEEICAVVAKEYFGAHSQSYVFGTAVSGAFDEKVNELIRRLHLDMQFKIPLGSTKKQKDGGLDIVAWIPFADQKDGQLIAFGQCKTGDNWENKLTELDPKSFFNSYCTGSPCADVIRLFFVAESFGIYKWAERSNKGGVIFDRTRIMEYLPRQIDSILLQRIKAWNAGALAAAQSEFI